jgi:penicillin-binding protein 1C
MFGFELPADLPYPVAVKTGTARGFSDTVAVFATQEYIVAAWTGRFDGRATHGVYGMKAAAPLARAGLLLASRGRDLTLPRRPDGVVSAVVCPLSGMRPAEACPHRKLEYFVKEHLPEETCDWHRLEGGQVTVRYPDEIRNYVERHRRRLGQVARLD